MAGVSEYYKRHSDKILSECKSLCLAEKICRSITWSMNKNCYLSTTAKWSEKKPSYNYYEFVEVHGMYLYFETLTLGRCGCVTSKVMMS